MLENIFNSLPVGYYTFHENEAFNFQMNRFYSFGAFGKDELITCTGPYNTRCIQRLFRL